MTSKKLGPVQTINEQNESDLLDIKVSNSLTVQIIPNGEFEFLATSNEVAKGYGISVSSLRGHQNYHKDELIEDVHYVKGVRISNTLKNKQPHQIYWTKAGIIRLGFFIKSERAKIFRDWAENVILQRLNAPKPLKDLPPATKRKHNRITPERMIDILHDVCMIEDKELRQKIAAKLKGGNNE